ncbi:hypothetical protein A9179_13025 [Pseudomonas alcaligenes]|uniref:Uncharacterized protein n=1 Tax=Aquipseudomonas alcaligenes TaxID=43263 RepID=A0ABR7S0U2_AQUAC|nr:hypothetical protein [Pseudomonas alcaligenes]
MLVSIWHQQNELLTTNAGKQIGTTDAFLAAAAEALQDDIAHGMTIAVVDFLEVVQIKEGEA